MAPTLQDVAGLKDLVNQLQDRIEKIERSMGGASPAEQLRMILMGPPGAGEYTDFHGTRASFRLVHWWGAAT